MKKLAPVNQKSVYHSAGDLYAKIMNEEIAVDRAEQANAALCTMNRTQALEIKRAEVTKETLRIIESKNFDQIPLEENN
jgi:hypothetical protein